MRALPTWRIFLVQVATRPTTPFRDLSDVERAGLARSGEDFKADRTVTPEEYRAGMDEFMARMSTKYPTAK